MGRIYDGENLRGLFPDRVLESVIFRISASLTTEFLLIESLMKIGFLLGVVLLDPFRTELSVLDLVTPLFVGFWLAGGCRWLLAAIFCLELFLESFFCGAGDGLAELRLTFLGST